jgi:GGDEF domain-containing protein
VESPFASVRLRSNAAKRYKRVDNATAMIWKLLMVAEHRFRKVNAPELMPQVAAGARYVNGRRQRGIHDAEKIAARIVTATGRPIPVAAGVATVSASVGIAIGSPGESAASIVARADEAMYRTKQDGKAGYRFASSIIG